MTSDPGNLPFLISIAAVLTILNSIVVLSTSALEAANISKIKQLTADEENPNKSAKRLIKLLDKPSKYRYTNRFLNYVLWCISFILLLNLDVNTIVLAVLYTGFTFAFCELFPRKLGRQHADGLALSFATVQSFMCIVTFPLIWVLLLVANIFLMIFKQDTNVDDKKFSEDDVMSMLEVGQNSGVLKEEGKKMIHSIFAFDDELAYEIMTPRTDVFYIDINDPPDEYLDQLMELRYSRIPVCESETDNIIGILHIKDYLIKARESGFDKVDIRSILRQPYFVPETKNIDALFFELQKEKQHIAILIDEYGGFGGIVTMEDIIEEVMGDIDDEYDEEDEIIEKIDDFSYMVDGNVQLDDLNEELNIKLKSDNSETIGGFIIDILGEIPEEGDIESLVKYENITLAIVSVKERRIEKVRITINPKDIDEKSENETQQ